MCMIDEPKTEIHFHQTTALTPELYIAGLADFGPGRSKLFGNSADEYLKVHNRSPSQADVTEGSGGIWERLHYDWSDPNHVVLTTTDSNTWGGASGHTYNFTSNPNGTTEIDVVVVREGKNLKGRVLGFVLRASAGVFWKKRLKTQSKPSKPGTAANCSCVVRMELNNAVASRVLIVVVKNHEIESPVTNNTDRSS